MADTITPFHLNKKKLFLRDTFYIPLRYGICIFLSLIIFTIFMVNLVSTYKELKNQSENLAKFLYPEERLKEGIDSIKSSMDIALGIALVLFILLYFFVQLNVLTYFKFQILKFRKGEYLFKLKNINSYDGINLIASFVANTYFSLFIFFFFLILVLTPLCFKEFWIIVWSLRKYWLMQVILVIFNVGLHAVLAGVFSDGYHIRFRFCYQVYEIYKMIIGFIVSLVIGLIRYILLVFFVILTLFRVDSSIIPTWVNKMFRFNFDFVNYRFRAFLKSHHAHNNPIVHTFALMLQAGVFKRKKARERKSVIPIYSSRYNNKIPEQIQAPISKSDGSGQSNQMDIEELKKERKSESQNKLDYDEKLDNQNRERLKDEDITSNPKSNQESMSPDNQETPRNNEEVKLLNKIQNPFTAENDQQIDQEDNVETDLKRKDSPIKKFNNFSDGLRIRGGKRTIDRKIAARWQLCVLLAMNPSLMRYRVSDPNDIYAENHKRKRQNFYDKNLEFENNPYTGEVKLKFNRFK